MVRERRLRASSWLTLAATVAMLLSLPWWLRYSLIGALLVPYIRDLPSTQSFNVCGVMVSPKWFTYLLALQVGYQLSKARQVEDGL